MCSRACVRLARLHLVFAFVLEHVRPVASFVALCRVLDLLQDVKFGRSDAAASVREATARYLKLFVES